jgi:hypothetical protein
VIDRITILGAQHVVALPNFADRELLIMAWTAHGADGDQRGVRVYAAAIGACCGIGQRAGASLAKSKYDALAYGGEVYSYLREQGATPIEIVQAATPLLRTLAEALFPREPEVVDAAGFTDAAGPPT